MDTEAVAFRDLHPTFLNLTLFVCRLFAGGGFRAAHILYENVAFDDGFLSELDSCPFHIPRTVTDVPESGQISFEQDKDEYQRSDHILQLIFLQHNQKAETLKRVSGLLTFYRIFIFSSIQNLELQAKWSENIWNDLSRNSSTLIIFHNKSNGGIRLYSLSKMQTTPSESINLPKMLTVDRDEDLFDSMLGENALDHSFGIIYVDRIYCSSVNASFELEKAIAHFYFKRFKMSYMDSIYYNCNKSGVIFVNHRYVRPQSKPIYSDLTYKTVKIDYPM